MAEPEGVPEFMHRFLDNPGMEQSLVLLLSVELRPQARQRNQTAGGPGVGQAEDEIHGVCVHVGVENAQHPLLILVDNELVGKVVQDGIGIILAPSEIIRLFGDRSFGRYFDICSKYPGQPASEIIENAALDCPDRDDKNLNAPIIP